MHHRKQGNRENGTPIPPTAFVCLTAIMQGSSPSIRLTFPSMGVGCEL